jgi:DNA (cytosine-5)-methyltransferase 1
MKAIDLYSGVGGWSLGLKMAGIEVVASYEWWQPANDTNRNNNHHRAYEQDIRKLDVSTVPQVDIVVGSPPCTQFSFANRGGQGDISDGLKDIVKFFEVVERVNPTFWAMENVPRVATILRDEVLPGGCLHRFSRLLSDLRIEVIHMEQFGIPQKRARCIAGNFDFDLLLAYRRKLKTVTLGEVIRALGGPKPIDPIYGERPLPNGLVDHELEEPLDFEEERMNREAKTHHPVYNNMPFPDPLGRPVRTITALCTRVSRESVVIDDERRVGAYRRLSVRERASLQTFPIDFQFFGFSHSQKIKLVGNAVPPLMSFYIAQALLGVQPGEMESPSAALKRITLAADLPLPTKPEKPKGLYNADRRFRAAVRGLRFKSGMRFELANDVDSNSGVTLWRVAFYFGSSKAVQELPLDSASAALIRRAPEASHILKGAEAILVGLDKSLRSLDPNLIQSVWARKQAAVHQHPYHITDLLASAADSISKELDQLGDPIPLLERVFASRLSSTPKLLKGWPKVSANAKRVLAGILVGSAANSALERPAIRKAA